MILSKQQLKCLKKQINKFPLWRQRPVLSLFVFNDEVKRFRALQLPPSQRSDVSIQPGNIFDVLEIQGQKPLREGPRRVFCLVSAPVKNLKVDSLPHIVNFPQVTEQRLDMWH